MGTSTSKFRGKSKLFVWVQLENEEISSKVYFGEKSNIDDLKDGIKIIFPSLEKVDNSKILVLYNKDVCKIDDIVSSKAVGNTIETPLFVRILQGGIFFRTTPFPFLPYVEFTSLI
jgi:hypothetical protein